MRPFGWRLTFVGVGLLALLAIAGLLHHTPWTECLKAPRRGRPDGPVCRIEAFEPWVAALDGVAAFERLEVLYWLHLSRRDLVRQSPANNGISRGTFSLRSPVRLNPIGTSITVLVGIDGPNVLRARSAQQGLSSRS